MNAKISVKKRIISVILTAVLAVSMLPLSVFAASVGEAEVITANGSTFNFNSFAGAVEYANKYGGTLKLLDDITIPYSENLDDIPFITGEFTLDLNGKNINEVVVGSVALDEEDEVIEGTPGTLTVTDNVGNGNIGYLAVNAGALTAAGGAITDLEAESYAATVNITGGEVEQLSLSDVVDEEISATVSGGSVQWIRMSGGTLTVNGGEYPEKINMDLGGGTTNITGGTFADLALAISFGDIHLTGGTFTRISTDPEVGSSEYKNPTLASLLGDGCAFYGTDGGIINADVLTLENVRIIADHQHIYGSGGKCTGCGAPCPHGNVDNARGTCEDCKTQLEAKVTYTGKAPVFFTSFREAIDSIPHNQKEQVTVTLLYYKYNLGTENLYLDRSNNIRLDLNGHTMSGSNSIVVKAGHSSAFTVANGELDRRIVVEAAGGDVTIEKDCNGVGTVSVTDAKSTVTVLGGDIGKLSLPYTDTESLKNIKLSGGYFRSVSFPNAGSSDTVVITDMLEAGYAFKDNKGILKTTPGGLVPYGLTVFAKTAFAELEVVKCEHTEGNDVKGYCNYCGKIYAAKITDKNGAVHYVEELQESDFGNGNTVVLFGNIDKTLIPGSSCTINLNGKTVSQIDFAVPGETLTLKGYGKIGVVTVGDQNTDSTLAIEDAAYRNRVEIGTLVINKTTNTKLTGGQFDKIERKDGGFVEELLADGYSFFDADWETAQYISGKTSLNKPYFIYIHDHWFIVNIDGETQCQDCGMPCHHTTIGEDGKCEDVCKRQIYTAVLTKADKTSVNYDIFADAWAAAIENEGSTLKPLCDLDLGSGDGSSVLKVFEGKFTLDLGGYTLEGTAQNTVVQVGGTANIKIINGQIKNKFDGSGSSLSPTDANAVRVESSSAALTLDGVEFTPGSNENARGSAVYVIDGKLTVTDSVFGGLVMLLKRNADAFVKLASSDFLYGIAYGYVGTERDYETVRGFFADGNMFFDGNGKYIDVTDDSLWEADDLGSYKAVTFSFDGSCSVKPHTHTYTDGICTECGYACPHDSGKNDREASYFKKAVCSVCHAEYGDYAKDTTAPIGEIKIKERTWWQSLLSTISFKLFYPEKVKAEITATDDSYTQAGYDETKHAVKIEYLISNTAMSEEAVKASTFKEYSGAIDLSDEDQYVIYVKLTDHAGNVAYASTDGFEIDTTMPVIEDMVDGGHYTYCLETRVKISDKNIDKITLDGEEKFLNSEGELYLRAYRNVEQTLVVTDKAGNTLTVYITGHTKHEIDEETLTCRYCGVAAAAKVTADDFVGYYATLTEALNAGLSDQHENVVITLLRTIAYGDPAAMRVSLWSCPTSFTFDLNGYTLGGELFDIVGGHHGTMTVISSRPGGAILMTVSMNSEDAVLVMGEGLDDANDLSGIVHIKGTLKIKHGKYGYINVSSSEKKKTELYGGEFVRIYVTAEGLTCADLLAPEYRYEGVSYADAKAATNLENVTVVPCAHASLDESGYCTDCGFHLVLSVEKDGVTKNFETFEDAIRYAEQKEGCTVKLLQDLTLDDATVGSLKQGYRIYLEKGRYTLDLAGKTLDIINGSQVFVREDCDLTIGDSAGSGKVISSSGGGDIHVGHYSNNNAKLTVIGGEFTVNVTSYNQSALVLKGGSFKKYVNSAKLAKCSPFVYLSEGYTFALMDPAGGNNYANEGNVEVDHDGSQMVMGVSVVPAPLTIDEQPTNLKFYLTSREDDKYVEFAVSAIGRWWGDMVNVTFEKEDGTVIEKTTVPAYESMHKGLSAVNFKVSDSGTYRVKLELKGYVLYSNTFNITVAECLHPEYDKTTHKCTQCGCDLAAAIIKDGKTTGYVDFEVALTAAQTDANKGCTLKQLVDVSKNVSVKSGSFTLDTASTLIYGKLTVAKGADLTVSGGRITGNVICAKGGKLTASNTYFEGTINCVGEGDFTNCYFANTVSAKGGIELNSCEIPGALSVSGNTEAEKCTVSGAVTVNNGGSFKSTGGTYKNTVNVKSGGTLEIISGTFDKKFTAEEGSKLIISGGSYTEVAAEKNVDFTINGGKFQKITVVGKKLIDCLAGGKAFEDMNNGFIIDGRVGIAGDVKVVDHTHTCVWKTSTHEKLCGCGFVEAVDTEAPVISGIENRGACYGPTEFTVTDENDFTVWVDGKQIAPKNGKYTAEPDNREHTITATDIAGNTVTYLVWFYKIYNVTLPTGAGYTIVLDPVETTVRHGDTYSFIVKINDGYSKTEDFKVLVNGNKLDELRSDTDSAFFAIVDVSENLVITVEGVADITAPEVEVSIRGNSFKEFLNRITFGLFFKQTQSVEVKANDFGSGVDKVEYLLSERAFENKDAITGDWTELTLNDDRKAYFSIEPNRKTFVYVRVTDVSGNITVVNSDGVVVYTDAEAITGAQNFIMDSAFDVVYKLNLNGNTLLAVYNNAADEIEVGTEYVLLANGMLMLKNSYLRTLAAGEYTFYLIFKPMGENYVDNNGNDAPSEVFLKLTVKKKTPVHDHMESDEKIYDGKPIGKPTFNTDSDGARTFEYKPADAGDTAYTTEAPKNVGKYTIRITTAETDTFKAASSTMEFEIEPKEVTISDVKVADKTYDGKTEAKITNAGTLSVNYDGDNLTIVQGKAAYDNKNVGKSKTVTFTGFELSGSAATNYKLTAQPTAVKADITAKEVTITETAVKNSKVYNSDTTAEITEKGKLNSKVSGDDLSFTAGSAAYSDKNVGKNKTVEFTGFKLTGKDSANYTLKSQPTAVKADITAKEVTITETAVKNSKVYDGKTTAEITEKGKLNGKISGDDLSFTAGSAAYSDKNVGKNKTVEFTGFKLTGKDSANYTLAAQPTAVKADITAKEVTITDTAVKDSKVYDGDTTAEITENGKLNGKISGDDLSFTAGNAAYSDKNVGENKTVEFTGFKLTGKDSANYTLKSQPTAVKADITAKEVTITETAVKNSKVYNSDTTAEITEKGKLNSKVSGDDLSFTAGSAAYSDKNVGKNKTVEFTGFKLAGKDSANYTLKAQPKDVKADITAKEVTITDTAVKDSKVYDGNTTAEITENGKLNGVVSGDDLGFTAGTAAYSDKNVGKNKTVEFTGFKLAGKDSANYTLKAQPKDVKADITAKEVTITDTAVKDSKVYDGNTTAEITENGKLNGVVSGDDLGFTAGTAAYSDKNVGKNKTVEFTGFKLAGKDSANYMLKAQPKSVTANITAKELTIGGLKVKNKSYDGKNTAAIDGTPTLVGLVDGDSLELINGTPTFDSVAVGKNISISFTDFTLLGDSETFGNYTLKQPSGITANIVEYLADGSEYTVNGDGWINTDFVITAKPGYKLSLTDTANGEWSNTLSATEETDKGKLTFYVKNTETGVISAAVTKSYKIDKTAPTGEVKLNERTAFQAFLNKITFGLFFNTDVNVKLTARDAASGIKSVLYFKSDKILTDEEVRAITDWTDNSDFDIAVKDMDKFIIYVRIEDNAGNVALIGSDGVTFDTTDPEIVGVGNGNTYYVTKKVAVDDENFGSVTLNGKLVEAVFTLAGDTEKTYVIRATDKAGNVTEYTVYMKPISSVTDVVSGITADNVKSSDEDTVSSVERQILDIAEAFDDGESTEEEWNKLTAAAAKCKELKQRISDVADEVTRLTDGVGSHEIEKVTSDCKAELEKLITDIDTLLGGDNLTDTEKTALEAQKAAALVLLGRISDAKSAAESEEIKAADGITKDNVKLDDKENLEKAEKALEGALRDFDGNYTEEENKDLETKLETVKAALAAIGNAEKAAEEIGKLPSADGVKLGDKNEVDRVKKLIDGLTENEKAMLGKDDMGKVDTLTEKIQKLAKAAAANNSPKTGDTGNLALWVALLFISSGALTGTAVAGKKKKRSVK